MCWVTLSGPNAPRIYHSDDEELILNNRHVDIGIGVDLDRDPEKYVSNYASHQHRHPYYPHFDDHNSCDEPTYRIAVPAHHSTRYAFVRHRTGRSRNNEVLRGRGRRRDRSPSPPPERRPPVKKRVRFADDVDERIVDPPDAGFRIQGEREAKIEVGGLGIGGRVKGEVRGDVRFDERSPRKMRRVRGRENLNASIGWRRESERRGRGFPPFGPVSEW